MLKCLVILVLFAGGVTPLYGNPFDPEARKYYCVQEQIDARRAEISSMPIDRNCGRPLNPKHLC